MGIFDFFKKKDTPQNSATTQAPQPAPQQGQPYAPQNDQAQFDREQYDQAAFGQSAQAAHNQTQDSPYAQARDNAAAQQPQQAPLDMMELMAIPREATIGIIQDVMMDGSDSVSGHLGLDDQMRIAHIANLVRNGEQVVASGEAVMQANSILSRLLSLPPEQRMNGVEFSYNGGTGELESRFTYPER